MTNRCRMVEDQEQLPDMLPGDGYPDCRSQMHIGASITAFFDRRRFKMLHIAA